MESRSNDQVLSSVIRISYDNQGRKVFKSSISNQGRKVFKSSISNQGKKVFKSSISNQGKKSRIKCEREEDQFTLEPKNSLGADSFGYEVMIRKGNVLGFESSFTLLGLMTSGQGESGSGQGESGSGQGESGSGQGESGSGKGSDDAGKEEKVFPSGRDTILWSRKQVLYSNCI